MARLTVKLTEQEFQYLTTSFLKEKLACIELTKKDYYTEKLKKYIKMSMMKQKNIGPDIAQLTYDSSDPKILSFEIDEFIIELTKVLLYNYYEPRKYLAFIKWIFINY